jgi:hypothetical protein
MTDETKEDQLIRYSYSSSDISKKDFFNQITSWKFPVPPQSYKFATLICLPSEKNHKVSTEFYIYVIGGLMIRVPIIYRLKIFCN